MDWPGLVDGFVVSVCARAMAALQIETATSIKTGLELTLKESLLGLEF